MKNQVTIEKKITFTVAGIEFDNLKTAQFFKRALTLHLQDLDPIGGINEEHEAKMLLNLWSSALGYPSWSTEFLVNTVMALQMPKPARKKKEIQNCMKVEETEFEVVADSDIYSDHPLDSPR